MGHWAYTLILAYVSLADKKRWTNRLICFDKSTCTAGGGW